MNDIVGSIPKRMQRGVSFLRWSAQSASPLNGILNGQSFLHTLDAVPDYYRLFQSSTTTMVDSDIYHLDAIIRLLQPVSFAVAYDLLPRPHPILARKPLPTSTSRSTTGRRSQPRPRSGSCGGRASSPG